MVDTVIVALPEENDYVNRISSQKAPHLTLMYLGEEFDMNYLEPVVKYIQHIAETSLYRFGLSVDRRGPLGDKDADVLFFEDGWQTKKLKEVIGYLLADDHISLAYNQQPKKYDKWIPHLTLGYPDDPAKEDERDYPGIHYVNFDRIAIWTGDSEGPEFRLKSYTCDEIAMSDQADLGSSFAEYFLNEEVLEHYGVKGMQWGVRKADRVPTGVALTTQAGKKVKAKGGKFEQPSEDAKRTAIQKQKAKRSSTDSLSNTELKQMIERMQLEANYERLARQQAGSAIVKKLLGEPKYRNQQVETISKITMPVRKGVGAGIGVGQTIKETDLSGIGR